MFLRWGTSLSRGHVSSIARLGRRTLLSHSHVSSMTNGCTCPIYYQGVVSDEKGSVKYTLPELIKNPSEAGNPLSRGHVSSMARAESRSLLSSSHVSSMTGGCTCPMYYQGVVSGEKGSVITRYKLPELIKNVSEATNPTLPKPCFKHD